MNNYELSREDVINHPCKVLCIANVNGKCVADDYDTCRRRIAEVPYTEEER